MALDDFLKMPAKERALVAMAVLLDGIEAEVYLNSDESLKKYAAWFSSMQADLRMPYVGSILRKALKELEQSQQ